MRRACSRKSAAAGARLDLPLCLDGLNDYLVSNFTPLRRTSQGF